MPNSDPSRERLLTLLAQRSFRLGEFKLSSGATSDYYIDCRTTTLHGEGARLCGRVLLDVIVKHKWLPAAIGGMTLGADPLVISTIVTSAQNLRLRNTPENPESASTALEIPELEGFLVRKAEKTHGTGRRIEGFSRHGAPVVIVDDVCTTGASTIGAIEAAREAGMIVVGVICLVERQEAGGRNAVEQSAAPAPFVSLFTAREVREAHLALIPARKQASNGGLRE